MEPKGPGGGLQTSYKRPPFLPFLQVHFPPRPGGVLRQLRDRGGPAGLRDGAAPPAGVTALHHSHDARSLRRREEVRQTGRWQKK